MLYIILIAAVFMVFAAVIVYTEYRRKRGERDLAHLQQELRDEGLHVGKAEEAPPVSPLTLAGGPAKVAWWAEVPSLFIQSGQRKIPLPLIIYQESPHKALSAACRVPVNLQGQLVFCHHHEEKRDRHCICEEYHEGLVAVETGEMSTTLPDDLCAFTQPGTASDMVTNGDLTPALMHAHNCECVRWNGDTLCVYAPADEPHDKEHVMNFARQVSTLAKELVASMEYRAA